MFLRDWDAGQRWYAPGALVCNNVDCSHVDFLVFLQLVELECFFAHETFSAFASMLGTADFFCKQLIIGHNSSLLRADLPIWTARSFY